MNTPGSNLKKRLSSVIRRPGVWMPLLLLVIGIASIIPAAWDAYRAHTIGWVGAIDNTQDRLDEIEQHDGLWSRKYPMSYTMSFNSAGELEPTVDDSDYYYVGIDRRVFVAPSYRADSKILQSRLDTMRIAEIRHITDAFLYTMPQVELIEPPYTEELMHNIEQALPIKIMWSRPSRVLPRHVFSPIMQHEGVMEPRPIHDEDGDPITNDAGELERTPVHAFSYYRVTQGTLETPMSWERFWVQAWGVLRWTLIVPMGVYVFLFLMYFGSYFHRRTRRRVEQGLCIKCAYPMQEDRAGKGMICTECGYLDHADTLNT